MIYGYTYLCHDHNTLRIVPVFFFDRVKILTRIFLIFRPEYMDMEEETGGLFWQAKARYRYTG
jgi:hypothetical protein